MLQMQQIRFMHVEAVPVQSEVQRLIPSVLTAFLEKSEVVSIVIPVPLVGPVNIQVSVRLPAADIATSHH